MSRRPALALALLAAGCTTRIHPAGGRALPDPEPRSAWARVLAEHVDAQGRVDIEALRADPRELERFVLWIGTSSPASEPQRFAREGEALVYWIEAFDALAMYAVVATDARPAHEGAFFFGNRFLVGGEWMSLDTLREEHLLALGDERALFALNDLSRGAPRLWREPLDPDRIDVQLDARAREFFNSERNVEVHYRTGTVYLSRLLDRHGNQILAAEGSFVAYLNRYRRSRLPARTFVRWSDYDWSLNSADEP